MTTCRLIPVDSYMEHGVALLRYEAPREAVWANGLARADAAYARDNAPFVWRVLVPVTGHPGFYEVQ